MKIKNFNFIIILGIIFVTFGFFISIESLANKTIFSNSIIAYAEDHEDEDEDEEQEDEDHDDEDDQYEDQNTNQPNNTETQIQTIYETKTIYLPAAEPELRYVTIVDKGFDLDTDKDGLVDALDPDPTIHQKQFFVDDDKDGIANAFDAHPNENDFDYILFEDSNNNGIIDSVEE